MSGGKRQRFDIDMRTFAKRAGATITVPAAGIVFNKSPPSLPDLTRQSMMTLHADCLS
ncbi:MAG TPA: hypothetical protein VII80_04865 [Pseudolabrys sp.]